LVDGQRIQREQLQTIRELQSDHNKDLDMIHDLQDRLKRKSVELTCMTKRAHEADARLVSLQASRDFSRVNSASSLCDRLPATSTINATKHDDEEHMTLTGQLSDVMERRVFHLNNSERARLIESRALSKHMSLSYDGNGTLLPGRYPHAHRSYVYQQDLAIPAQEKIRLQNITSKHNIEHIKQRKLQRATVAETDFSRRQAGDHAAVLAQHDDPSRKDQCEDEMFILSLMERVHQLEAMYDAQTEYCDDLSHENDELIKKFEMFIASRQSAAESQPGLVAE
jgi:hypothetical protein